MIVDFTASAKLEMDEAFKWYEFQGEGLGNKFAQMVDSAVSRIIKYPRLATMVDENVYRVLVSRFPYVIFYMLTDNRIIILSIGHQHRLPRDWKLGS